MFWEEVLESIEILLQTYRAVLVGMGVTVLVIAVLTLIATGISPVVVGIVRGLERLGVPALLIKVLAATIAGLRRVGQASSNTVWRFLGFVALVLLVIAAIAILWVAPAFAGFPIIATW